MSIRSRIRGAIKGVEFEGPCCDFCGKERAVGTRISSSGEAKKVGSDCKKAMVDTPRVNKLKLEQEERERLERKRLKEGGRDPHRGNNTSHPNPS